ncbi:autotransporter assembly complex protein TamA [Roseomonas populi]|uniref:Autotransporter assembly complex protein TamA n=1 Tax=Roseomonas populi TaxID=3121582 RepID=A0ABT1XBL3_9PROT|nr:autotransporter assembly complex family protein [Roseomonas pecuniae]MCR0985513.1 autotransporter assembly complex protein TamA [Roseomonas pecuniae]
MRSLHPGFALLSLLLIGTALAQPTSERASEDPRPAASPEPDDSDGPVRSYEVTFTPTGDARLNTAMEGVSVLRRLRESVPTSAEGLVARALQDQGNMRLALRSEGYYGGTAKITLAGEPPDAEGLAVRLAARGTDPVPVVVTADAGTQYTISSATLRPDVADADITGAGEVAGLGPGDPARAEAVNSTQETVLTRLREAGHPFAGVPRRQITVDHDAHTMEVVYFVQPGPRARFAQPVVEGSENVDPELLRRASGVLAGETYDPRELDRVRRDVLALGVFGTVRARTGERLDPDGRLPVTFLVAERPFRAVGITGAYETRYGPTVRAYWEHRNLFGAAERLRVEAELSRPTQRGVSDWGYRLGANLRQPWFAGLNATAVTDVTILRERLLAYDRDAVTAGFSLERKIDPRLTLSAGIAGEIGRTVETDQTLNYTLLSLPLGARFDGTDNVLDPSRGYRANLLVSPTVSFGDSTELFTRIRGSGSAYFDLTGDKGSILALRAGFGTVAGAEAGTIPPHLRFYAGGGGSVRGYDYQIIGPRRPDRTPRGGLSLLEGSVELRQRITGPYGIAVFADAGSVGQDPLSGFGDLAVGVGAGVRYATAIGPIRADIALPLTKVPGNSGFGLYVGIGQAF